MTNTVNKPSHYIGVNGMEVEEVLQNFLPKINDGYTAHRLGSAVEYILRSSEKNGLEDLKKAKRNLEQVIYYEERKAALEKEKRDNLAVAFVRKSTEQDKEIIKKQINAATSKTIDPFGSFMRSLAKIPVQPTKQPDWVNYLVPNTKITTHYHGTNPND